MRHDREHLLERAVTAEDGVEHGERDAGNHRTQERERHDLEDRAEVRRVGHHRFEPIVLRIGQRASERLALLHLLIQKGVLAHVGAHEQEHAGGSHQHDGRQHTERARACRHIRVRGARREEHADDPRG